MQESAQTVSGWSKIILCAWLCVRNVCHLTLLVFTAVFGDCFCLILDAQSKQVRVILVFEGDDGGFGELHHLS